MAATTPDLDELTWLGAAIYNAQRVEFALYGIAAHLSHLPEAQKERRFRELTGEKFLRGDPAELKATLGQLVTLFGDRLLITTPELIAFYEDRNLIAHNYYRQFQLSRDAAPLGAGREFLEAFTHRADHWVKVLSGLLVELRTAAAEKEGRTAELLITPEQAEQRRAYHQHVAKHLKAKAGVGGSSKPA